MKCLITSLLCDLSGPKEPEMELFERRVEVTGMYKKKNWNKTSILNEYQWKMLKGHTGTRVSCDIQEEGDTITKSEKTGEKVPYELKIFSSHFFG